ncbi:MAG: gluconate:H+ symporter [Cyclobacteriaceae bacterium]
MDINLILAISGGIAILLILILYFKIQAFLALLISSLTVGLLAGMSPDLVIKSITSGMGSTLGFVATVVGLGALFGSILEHSGGSEAIARFLLKKFGEKNADWALMSAGFIIAIPVFFDVAFIILAPIIYSLQKTSGKSLLLYALPLLAGLAITHSFIPPTPGPVAVAEIVDADLGWVILVGLIIGLPTAFISGPIFSKHIGNKIFVGVPDYITQSPSVENKPPISTILAIIAIPILLILLNTASKSFNGFHIPLINLIGHPFTALIIANLLAWYFLGIKRGFTKEQLLDINSKSLAPAGIIILLTGAGGAFKQVLIDTGSGQMIAEVMSNFGIHVVLFAFIVAALVRILQGSATVAMITAAGVVSTTLTPEITEFQKALLVITIASGATILSHVNDSGFWLVNRYLGLTEKQTFKTWTVMETIIALSGLVLSSVLWYISSL